jgi:hypothetical protein
MKALFDTKSLVVIFLIIGAVVDFILNIRTKIKIIFFEQVNQLFFMF